MSQSLTCSICELRKPVGIFSAQGWGSVDRASEPAYACPDCQAKHPDWLDQLTQIAGASS